MKSSIIRGIRLEKVSQDILLNSRNEMKIIQHSLLVAFVFFHISIQVTRHPNCAHRPFSAFSYDIITQSYKLCSPSHTNFFCLLNLLFVILLISQVGWDKKLQILQCLHLASSIMKYVRAECNRSIFVFLLLRLRSFCQFGLFKV